MSTTSARVLYLASGRGFRSGNTLLRKIEGILSSFHAVGAEVRFICGGDILPHSGAAVPLSQKIKSATKFPLGSFLYHSTSEFRDIRHDWLLRRAIEAAIAEFRPSLIWERSSRLHTSGARAARVHGIPFVLEWVDALLTNYGVSLFKALGNSGERFKMSRADFIVVPSARLVDLLSRQWRIASERFVVAYNGVDPEEFSPCRFERNESRDSFGIERGAFVVGFVGTYQWYHKVEYLIEAGRELKETGQLEDKLFLMVGDGPRRQDCEALAARYGVSENLRFLGMRPKSEVARLLSACDAAVLPGEGGDILCPIKVVEYLAMGLPVVVPGYEGNREVVVDGENGFCFRPKDPKDLAAKVHRLDSDRELARRISLKARESVLQRFSWEKTWGVALKSIVERLGSRGERIEDGL